MDNRQTFFTTTTSKESSDNQSELNQKINMVILKRHAWRLYIDGADQQYTNDPYYYDKKRPDGMYEPGYHDSMTNTFDYMLKTLDEPLTLSLIVKLHDMTISKISFTSGAPAEKRMGIRKAPVFFCFGKETTLGGVTDILETYQEIATFVDTVENKLVTSKTPIEMYKCIHSNYGRYFRADPFTTQDGDELQRIITNKLNKLIADYYKDIDSAKSEKDKVIAIFKFAHAADILHPFMDANIRTFVFVIVNKLLLKHGCILPIFYDPNDFDCCAAVELYQSYRFGQNEWIVVASKEGDTELLTYLLNSDTYLSMNADEKKMLLNRAMINAITNDHLSIIELLLKHTSCNYHYKIKDAYFTPLHYAMLCKRNDIVKRLINAHAQTNQPFDISGDSPLIFAIKQKNIEWVKLLLENGANVHQRNYQGESAFVMAFDIDDPILTKLIFDNLKPSAQLLNMFNQYSTIINPTSVDALNESQIQGISQKPINKKLKK